MNNLLVPNEILSISGFDRATFSLGKTVIILENGIIKYIDLGTENPSFTSMNLKGRVTAMSVSSDFSTFAISTEEENVAKVIVFSLDVSMEKEKTVFCSRYLSSELCISHVSEIIASLSILHEQVHIQTFDVKDGINNSFGNIIAESIHQFWQISFCPADESVLCALGGGTAYLLRSNGGQIENFSTIFLPNVLCHNWANDVNIIFGSQSGFLHIYRETIPLDVVDITPLAASALHNAVNTSILVIRSTTRKFACQTGSGVILVFESNVETGPIWDSSEVFIIPDFTLKNFHSLSFDFFDGALLCDNGTTLQILSIQYFSKINTFTGSVVAIRHCSKIVEVKSTETNIITLDQNGLLVVFSKQTNRALCSTLIPDAFFFTVVSQSHKLLLVTKENIISYTIMLEGLKNAETIFEKSLIMAADSYDMSILAVLYETGFVVFGTEDRSILMCEETKEKKNTKKLLISKNNKFLIFLMKNDSVICIDISSKKTLWASDFKLHFFQSIAYSNSTLLLLNQKFIVTRIKHGKSLSNVNLHASDVGFSITSDIIEANNEFVFVSTDAGELLCASTSALEEPFVVNTKLRNKKITKMRAFENELLIGYDDGSVAFLELKRDELVKDNKDIVLCYFNEVSHLKTLLREMDAERNSMKESTEKFLNLFTERTNTELAQIKKTFDDSTKTYKAKLKAFELDFHESTSLQTKTIASLKELYENENSHQKKKYELMLEGQIKKSFKQLDEKNLEVKLNRNIAEKNQREIIQSFHEIEKQLITQLTKYKTEVQNNHSTISELQNNLKENSNRTDLLKAEYIEYTNRLNEIHEKDSELLVAEIWSLKGTCVQLNEKKQLIDDEFAKLEGKLKAAQRKIDHLFNENQHKENTIQQLTSSTKKLENARVEDKKIYMKLKTSSAHQEKVLAETLLQNQRWKNRIRGLEAKIDELTKHVYNPRNLEHAVLNLIATSQNTDLDKKSKFKQMP